MVGAALLEHRVDRILAAESLEGLLEGLLLQRRASKSGTTTVVWPWQGLARMVASSSATGSLERCSGSKKAAGTCPLRRMGSDS